MKDRDPIGIIFKVPKSLKSQSLGFRNVRWYQKVRRPQGRPKVDMLKLIKLDHTGWLGASESIVGRGELDIQTPFFSASVLPKLVKLNTSQVMCNLG